MKNGMLLLILGLLTFSLAVPSRASVLSVDVSGILSSSAKLDGSELGASTPFSYHAIIDSTGGRYIFDDTYQYDALTTFTIAGNTYTNNLFINLTDKTGIDDYSVNIMNDSEYYNVNVFGLFYAAATPTYTANTPIASILSDLQGGLVLDTLNISPAHTLYALYEGTPQAAINDASAVPEPSTCILLGIALGAVGFARKKMNKHE